MAGAISYMHNSHHWNKPLNPILGETYQAVGDDGSMYYLEKVQHKPPVTSFYCTGARNQYRWYGYDSFAAHAHMNSITVSVEGFKQIDYPAQGCSIRYTCIGDAI
jgi:hypothetical protein